MAASDPFAHARPNWSLHPSFNGPESTSASSAAPRATLPLAATAPVLQCYEEAVQEPLVECTNLDSLYSQVQLDDTDRYDARVLREDFCSTAIVATTWLSLDHRNRSQGVDIDFDALSHTHQRLGPKKVTLLQSPNFSQGAGSSFGKTREIVLEPTTQAPPPSSVPSKASDTWAPGAATERFDRKLAKKLEREAKKSERKAKAHGPPSASGLPQQVTALNTQPRMTLLHSDVLDLPVPLPDEDVSGDSTALEPPDIIASLNYAMAYFHDRKTLLSYLRMALKTLRPKSGVFITDMFGGPSTGEVYPDQNETWGRFQDEAGFGRDGGDGQKQIVLAADGGRPRRAARTSEDRGLGSVGSGPRHDKGAHPSPRSHSAEHGIQRVLEVTDAPKEQDVGTRAEWPRGKLKMVRTGKAHGGFEYWREDGPVDWMTNRFRMSLSFRFSDGSWLRDVFSYDFRVWSLKELVEAMEEVGFVRVKVFVLPRNAVDDDAALDSDDDLSCPSSPELSASINGNDEGSGGGGDEGGLEDMASLLRRTEREERTKTFYRGLNKGEKLFANRSFGTYIVACAP